MRRLLLAASALALAAAMSPAVTGPVQAASAESPYCDMAKTQKNLVAWNNYYHCLDTAQPAAHVAARQPERTAPSARPQRMAARAQPAPAKSPYCDMAKTQKNPVAWNSHYHCLDTAPSARQASAQSRPVYAQAQLAPAKSQSPYCDMAKTQKNLVAWNAYYHCLSR